MTSASQDCKLPGPSLVAARQRGSRSIIYKDTPAPAAHIAWPVLPAVGLPGMRQERTDGPAAHTQRYDHDRPRPGISAELGHQPVL